MYKPFPIAQIEFAKDRLAARTESLKKDWKHFPFETAVWAGPWINYLLISNHMPENDRVPWLGAYFHITNYKEAKRENGKRYFETAGTSIFVPTRFDGHTYNIAYIFDMYVVPEQRLLDTFFRPKYPYFFQNQLYISVEMWENIQTQNLKTLYNEPLYLGDAELTKKHSIPMMQNP